MVGFCWDDNELSDFVDVAINDDWDMMWVDSRAARSDDMGRTCRVPWPIFLLFPQPSLLNFITLSASCEFNCIVPPPFEYSMYNDSVMPQRR
jgi:hypothetical protein